MRHLRRHGPLHRLLLVVVAISLFMIGYYWGNQYRQTPQIELSAVMLRPPIVPPLDGLVDQEGRPFGAQRLKDHVSLLAFSDSADENGRALLARLIRIRNRLVDRPRLQEMLLIVFVDTAAGQAATGRLGDQIGVYGEGFVGVTGPAEALSRLAAALGVPMDSGTSSLFLADGEGRIVALFPPEQTLDSIATDLKKYADSQQ